jgi:glycerol-3-phosphate cytidylyltransferase-like family protein
MLHAAIGGKVVKVSHDEKVSGAKNRVYLVVEYKRETKSSPAEYVGVIVPEAKYEDIKTMIDKGWNVNFSLGGFGLVTSHMWDFDSRILACVWSQFTL